MAPKSLLATLAASLILLLFFCSLSVGSSPNGSVTDHQALLSFKSLVSVPSGSLASWNQSSSYCNWKGVSCNNRIQRVAIGGVIPMNITRCSGLEVINLTDNEVNGAIPPELDHLYHLKVLKLAQNNLSGTIPAALGNLSHLSTLNLATNSLHGPIPEVLSRLWNLQHLQISLNINRSLDLPISYNGSIFS